MEYLGSLPLPIDITIWFGTSVICTSGSKHILNAGIVTDSRWLTCIQLSISAIIGKSLLVLSASKDTTLADVPSQVSQLYWLLSLTFVVGFGTLNASFSYLPVSLAMTLRAAEPIFSVLLVRLFSSDTRESTSLALCLTLIPIVLGTSLSSLGSLEFSVPGLVLVCLANIAFPLRMIIFKQLRAVTDEDNLQIFFGVCWRASSILLVGNGLMDALLAMGRAPAASATLYEAMANSDLAIPISTSSATVLLVNGACYFGYLQWSFIVGSKVSLVTHAVCNAMRRPVNIIVAVWFFGTHINLQNGLGILLACSGALLYSRVKQNEAASSSNTNG